MIYSELHRARKHEMNEIMEHYRPINILNINIVYRLYTYFDTVEQNEEYR